MSKTEAKLRFRQEIVPHFESAYNLARWLTRSETDADDVMQEASLRAFRFMSDVDGKQIRAWFLQIVRNTAYTFLKKRNSFTELNDDEQIADPAPDPAAQLLNAVDAQALRSAIESLPAQYREVLILREFEDLSYEEIAEIIQAPEGTVMSRLSRARTLLKGALNGIPRS